MRRVRGQKSVMKDFGKADIASVPRSRFNLSHGHKTTFDASVLVPIDVFEVLPGDTHSVTANIFARLATPITPIMDNLFLDTFWFFVPNRLVWDNWERFMGAQDDPGDSTDYIVPMREFSGQLPVGTLADYMGIPVNVDPGTAYECSALPFRAYFLIWNEWFRDQNLQPSVVIDTGDDGSAQAVTDLKPRGKRHDYFTSCLPWPQKGPGVDLPLGTFAPVVAEAGIATNDTLALPIQGVDPSSEYAYLVDPSDTPGTDPIEWWRSSNDLPPDQGMLTDLSNASAATINDLRQAFQIQKLQERDARGGTRYQELVLSHFGVQGGDARLQRPEYLGGSGHRVGITQVPQTSETLASGETPQGNLAAYGTVTGRGGFTRSFVEHGYVIGLAAVRADLTYQQGLHRSWSRSTKYDFYWPSLARIGEQAVLNKELYLAGDENDDLTFGYQERFAEYKFGQSRISGLFRSAAPETLDYWHLSQDFENLPTLGPDFIEEDVPLDRVIAVPDEPHVLFDGYFQHSAVRAMPINGSPGFIDHF